MAGGGEQPAEGGRGDPQGNREGATDHGGPCRHGMDSDSHPTVLAPVIKGATAHVPQADT